MTTFCLDLSTINRAWFDTLTRYDVPTHYRLGSAGMGCFMDAPGYPTYFWQPIYNALGNTPDSAPDSVLTVDGITRIVMGPWRAGDTWETRQAKVHKRLRELYAPLPIEHPRVQAWISALVGYFNNCYVDLQKPEDIRRNCDQLYMPKRGALDFEDPTRMVPRALLDVRDIYPDYNPTELPAGGYGSGGPGDWWERHTVRPTVAECPGPFFSAHKTAGWCQFCGSIDDASV